MGMTTRAGRACRRVEVKRNQATRVSRASSVELSTWFVQRRARSQRRCLAGRGAV